MICPQCRFDNPDTNKFCGECGTALQAVCSECGTTNPPAHKFCGECGTAVSSRPAGGKDHYADAGERRFVSVLFADLVGFTTYSEARDPEEVRAMLTRYFDRARRTIERFGGAVDKFIGDAVTAFWGATLAQEDDAERAVRAALELVDSVTELGRELGVPDLRLRAGVLSGETSVGSGGNETGLVVGDIVNTAARLQSAAAPGTVLVGDSTKVLTEQAIQYQHVGEQDLRGKSVPVASWRAMHVAGAVGGRGRSSGLEAPFVGRDKELRMLKDQVHATSEEGHARLVSIVGEAGIGKSRLVWEFQKYLDGLTETFRWHQGRSPAYGGGVTLWALGEMVRSRAGIMEKEDPHRARTKLRTAVSEHVPDLDEQRWLEPRLAALLGLENNPSGDRQELFSAIRTFFQRIAEEATTILVFEDLHWADESQLDFIEELVEVAYHLPILVVTLARPQLLERRPGWGSSRRSFMSLHLGPMGDGDMSELVSGLAPGIPGEIVALVVDHAAGVPLYAVEYVRTLVHAGDLALEDGIYRATRRLDALRVPDSLHAVVGARLDRLDDADRALVQDAAVLGHAFTVEGLEVLSGKSPDELEARLRELARRELFRFETDPRSPERGQYQFVQGVIREVAYGRIAKSERRDRHLRVAEYFRATAPIEAAAVIASHYLNAYEVEPDDRLAQLARDALMAAAHRAADLYSDVQALDLAKRALEVPGSEGDRAPILLFTVRPAASLFQHDLTVANATEALHWYRRHGSPVDMVRAAGALGIAYLGREAPMEAAAAMRPYFDESRLDEPEMRRLGSELARAHMLAQDDLELSADIARRVLVAAEEAGDTEMLVEAMNTRGTSIGGVGRIHEAIALLREAVRLGEMHDLAPATMRAINNLVVIDWANGLTAIEDHVARGYELAGRLGRLEFVTRMLTHRMVSLWERGDFRAAIDLSDQTDIGDDPVWSAFHRSLVVFLEWQMTGAEETLAAAHEPILSVGEPEEPQMVAEVRAADARIRYLQGDADGALAVALSVSQGLLPAHDLHATAIKAALDLGSAEDLAAVRQAIGRPIGRRINAFATAAEAGLAAVQGRPEEAVPLFQGLLDMVEEAEGPLSLALWKAVFGRALPEHPEARRAAEEAHAWLASVEALGWLGFYEDVWQQHLRSEAARVG